MTDEIGTFLNDESIDKLPWHCDFGETSQTEETCGFNLDEDSANNWTLAIGPTQTMLTGPSLQEATQHGLF